jgi:hypothetical protein
VPFSASNLLVAVVSSLFAADSGALSEDWESAIPALGSGFLPKRLRTRSLNAALSRSKVPSMRHLPNHH